MPGNLWALAAVFVLPFLASSSQQTSAVQAVTRLYHDYAWEAADSITGKSPLFAADAAVMRTYLDSGLVEATLANRQCQIRTGEVCNLDFEPMWDSQDPARATVEIVATRDSAVVRANVRYPAPYGTRVVTYHMRHTAKGWRVADMGAADWPSLLRMLRQPAP